MKYSKYLNRSLKTTFNNNITITTSTITSTTSKTTSTTSSTSTKSTTSNQATSSHQLSNSSTPIVHIRHDQERLSVFTKWVDISCHGELMFAKCLGSHIGLVGVTAFIQLFVMPTLQLRLIQTLKMEGGEDRRVQLKVSNSLLCVKYNYRHTLFKSRYTLWCCSYKQDWSSHIT